MCMMMNRWTYDGKAAFSSAHYCAEHTKRQANSATAGFPCLLAGRTKKRCSLGQSS